MNACTVTFLVKDLKLSHYELQFATQKPRCGLTCIETVP